jgi:hypothetical protein
MVCFGNGSADVRAYDIQDTPSYRYRDFAREGMGLAPIQGCRYHLTDDFDCLRPVCVSDEQSAQIPTQVMPGGLHKSCQAGSIWRWASM